MERIAFIDGVEPTEIEVAGASVRMFFSMRAAARLEKELGKPYAEAMAEILQLPGPDGTPAPMMTFERQRLVIRVLMEEAGQTVSDQELQGLHMAEFSRLARAAQAEIFTKSARGGDAKKN